MADAADRIRRRIARAAAQEEKLSRLREAILEAPDDMKIRVIRKWLADGRYEGAF